MLPALRSSPKGRKHQINVASPVILNRTGSKHRASMTNFQVSTGVLNMPGRLSVPHKPNTRGEGG